MPLLFNAAAHVERLAAGRPTRHKNSTKPLFATAPPRFYQCAHCHRLLIESMPLPVPTPPSCCGSAMTNMDIREADAVHYPAMHVSGGFERNSLTVSVGQPAHPMTPEHYIAWIYLYSFQGGQLKCLSPGESSTATFALAEQDAYVYCDRPICKGRDCKFNCKRGFSVWAYCNLHGLFHNSL